MHTPESWRDFFLKATTEQQLDIAEHVLQNAERSIQCFMEDHQGAVKMIATRGENELYLAATEQESDLYVATANVLILIIQADYNIRNISTPINGDLHWPDA
jgi:hypothetical protein